MGSEMCIRDRSPSTAHSNGQSQSDQSNSSPIGSFDLCDADRGQAYVEKGIETFEEQSRHRQLRSLQRKASKYGFELAEAI